MLFGQCDCCGKPRVLHRTQAYGIDIAACAECHGNPLTDDIDDYVDLAVRYIEHWLKEPAK